MNREKLLKKEILSELQKIEERSHELKNQLQVEVGKRQTVELDLQKKINKIENDKFIALQQLSAARTRIDKVRHAIQTFFAVRFPYAAFNGASDPIEISETEENKQPEEVLFLRFVYKLLDQKGDS